MAVPLGIRRQIELSSLLTNRMLDKLAHDNQQHRNPDLLRRALIFTDITARMYPKCFLVAYDTFFGATRCPYAAT
jgi:hypothetical protein